jgi:hypothetical protein
VEFSSWGKKTLIISHKMTRAQGQEYLLSTLRPLVPLDSLDMVIEYLSSYDPFNKTEMVKFLEDVCGTRKNFNEIIEKYIQLCQQLDKNSTVFVPKQQYFEPKSDGTKKVSSSPHPHQQQRSQHTQQQQPHLQQQQRNAQQPQQSHQLKKKNQLPNQSESLTFVSDKKTQESSNPQPNKKQNHQQQQPQLGTQSSNRNGKPKKVNSSEKSSDTKRQICGCFATHHEYCTSCMSCGRIHCSIEGFGACLFCGSDLFPPLSAEIVCDALGYQENNEIVRGAYLQKDKLLQFDKEHAKRTQVHDAQVCPLFCSSP